jgi:hypothetical protein
MGATMHEIMEKMPEAGQPVAVSAISLTSSDVFVLPSRVAVWSLVIGTSG